MEDLKEIAEQKALEDIKEFWRDKITEDNYDLLDARTVEGYNLKTMTLTMQELADAWGKDSGLIPKPKFILAQPDDINNEFIL